LKVLLVDMPFAGLDRPALGLSLLKAKLAEGQFDCDILYGSVSFADAISPRVYSMIADDSPDRSLAGEWVFADQLYGVDRERSDRYVRHVLAGMPQEFLQALRHARDSVPTFLGDLLSTIPWSDYQVVGFASSGDQNLAAMCMARRLRERFPGLVIVAGGANWHGSMGVAQLRAFPFVDMGFLGEAEESLLAVIRAVAQHESLASIPGVAVRDGGCAVTWTAPRGPDMDAVPAPDFDDYFRAIAASGLGHEILSHISVETSRGCSWAQRHPCSFCGLSGPVRRYRVKSPTRALSELRRVAARWPGCDIDIVDNMVPRSFIRKVLPDLICRPLNARLFLEARPNLSENDVETIVAAGASLQVGIESLSDHILALMGKGTSVRRIVRLLRRCKKAGLAPTWNLILGTPGETDDDYREMIELLPSLRQLQPPQVCAPLSLVRFSPLFESFRELGIHNVRPSAAYRLTYRVPDDLMWGLAGAFDFDEELSLVRRALRYRLRSEVRAWQNESRPPRTRRLKPHSK
jgi:ribosomal peptide maturation radical SAM protein 1